jgi:hypothetical protein
MELMIPLIAMGGVYFATTTQRAPRTEGFGVADSALPNTDVADKNYPFAVTAAALPKTDVTSQLATVNVFDAPGVYTDKYFAPQQPPAGGDASYTSLTGAAVGSDYFSHNNMVPFYKTNSHRPVDSAANEAVIDSYTGAGSLHYAKQEQAPLFDAGQNVYWATGMPSATDFIQSRINPSMRMANINPFKEDPVGPGLGPDAARGGEGGFNSGMMARELWTEKTADDMRIASKPKATELGLLGYEGAASAQIKRTGTMGVMEKNRVETSFEMGRDRLFTTTGAEKGPTARATHIPRDVTRPETDADYIGAAGARNPAHYVSGEYMDSTNIELGAEPLRPAFARNKGAPSVGDYSLESNAVYNNNRTANRAALGGSDDYYGAAGGALGALVAPIVDALRPSRRENVIGSLRPYQNAKASVNNTYVFNPRDKLPPTIRETTDQTRQYHHINAGQRGGGYATAPATPITNQRDTTTEFFYAGNAGGTDGTRGPRTYGAEYAQRNNESKPAMLTGYTPSGGMATLNHAVNLASRERDTRQANTRPAALAYAGSTNIPSAATMGRVNSAENTLYSGAQRDRNNGEVLAQLKGNPYVHNVLSGL